MRDSPHVLNVWAFQSLSRKGCGGDDASGSLHRIKSCVMKRWRVVFSRS